MPRDSRRSNHRVIKTLRIYTWRRGGEKGRAGAGGGENARASKRFQRARSARQNERTGERSVSTLRILGNQIEIESIEIEFPLIMGRSAVTSFPPAVDRRSEEARETPRPSRHRRRRRRSRANAETVFQTCIIMLNDRVKQSAIVTLACLNQPDFAPRSIARFAVRPIILFFFFFFFWTSRHADFALCSIPRVVEKGAGPRSRERSEISPREHRRLAVSGTFL